MTIVIAGLLAGTAFVVLIRLLWLNARPLRSGTLITLAAVVLVIALGVLAATGRLHWLAAVAAAILPFLRRGLGLVRYVPVLGRLFSAYRSQGSSSGQRERKRATGAMSADQAREVLGLGSHPTRDEVIAAHRRLMQKVHPDRGGSNFLAQQLNEAKQVLLKEL